VTGHKTGDWFTNAVSDIIHLLGTYLFILYITNIFVANAMKSTTDSIWTNLSYKSISERVVVPLDHTCF